MGRQTHVETQCGTASPDGEVCGHQRRKQPSCERCRGPRSVGSGRFCRACYTGMAAERALARPAPTGRRAPAGERRPSLQRQRVLNGQCPSCGKDAAPYRLCADHRALGSLSGMLRRWEKAGALTKTKAGGANRWSATANMHEIVSALPARKMPVWEGGDDKRTQPRLRGVRVDVEQTLIQILRDMGRPASVEEIQFAWGRLRGERKHGSLAGDIKKIVEAKRRRDQRSAKRASFSKKISPDQSALRQQSDAAQVEVKGPGRP